MSGIIFLCFKERHVYFRVNQFKLQNAQNDRCLKMMQTYLAHNGTTHCTWTTIQDSNTTENRLGKPNFRQYINMKIDSISTAFLIMDKISWWLIHTERSYWNWNVWWLTNCFWIKLFILFEIFFNLNYWIKMKKTWLFNE